jgi:hypothetical protein
MRAALTPKSLRPNRDDDRTSMRLPGQRRAYPDIVPLTVGLAPDAAFNRALDTAGRMGWTIVAADEAAARAAATDPVPARLDRAHDASALVCQPSSLE